MASVDLVHCWLHDATDLSSFVRLRARNVQTTKARQVERRRYAGGRIRSIIGPSRPITASFDAIQVPRADIDMLEGWLGETLLYRDPRGLVTFGFVADIDIGELIYTERANFQVTFQGITGTVAV